MLLAIDTATQAISLALHDGTALIAEHSWRTSHNHTVELAPAVAELMVRLHITAPDLTAMAVCIGPGSYTGLRIGVALAKGMASALRIPLVGVLTSDILALGQPQFTGTLMALAAAGRGRVIAVPYGWKRGRWRSKGDPQIVDWAGLIALIDGATILSGEIDADGVALLDAARAEGTTLTLATPPHRLRRAGFLAEEAWGRLRETHDHTMFAAARLAPVYVRPVEAPPNVALADSLPVSPIP